MYSSNDISCHSLNYCSPVHESMLFSAFIIPQVLTSLFDMQVNVNPSKGKVSCSRPPVRTPSASSLVTAHMSGSSSRDIQTCLSLITSSFGSLKVGTEGKQAQDNPTSLQQNLQVQVDSLARACQTTTQASRRHWEGPGLLPEESLGKTGKSQKEAEAIIQ